MDLSGLRDSLSATEPPPKLSAALRALWHEAKGDWKRAHEIVQEEDDESSAWVHAYLHRKEGDLSNAGYWYRRASKPVCSTALDYEWQEISLALLLEQVR
jgi:hypothetical protein